MAELSLKVASGSLAGVSIPLDDESVVFGRDESGVGQLGGDRELSRKHARLSWQDGRLIIEDLGSRNGTFVNGARISEPTALGAGDSIEVGGTKLDVQTERRPDAAEPAAPEAPPEGAKVLLRVTSGPAAGRRIPLGDEPLVIGRHEPGEGALGEDPELSRKHARVFLVSGRLAVEDLESTNGTFVNGRRVVYPTVIKPGDSIEVGGTTLEVTDSPTERPSGVSRAAVSAVHRMRTAESGLLGRLADFTSRRPKHILVGTAVFFLLCVGIGAPVVGLLSGQPKPDPNVESTIAKEDLEEASGIQGGVGLIALVRTTEGVRTPAGRAKVERVVRTIRKEPEVARVLSLFNTRDEAFLSKDRKSTYVAAVFKVADNEVTDKAVEDLQVELEKQPGVVVGGEALTGPTVGDTVGEDLGKAERLAFPILFVISLFVFRGVVAALLPLLVGILTIFGTFLALRLITETVYDVSVFALNMVIALGLGLAIDYSLFIVSRYREEVIRSGYGPEAIRRTLETAGRTIIFSALTVAAALASLLVFPQSFVRSMGIGGAVCSLIALGIALTVLPAILRLLGPRINAGSTKRWRETSERVARGESKGFWYRLSHVVMRRPATVALASAALLIAVGLPFLRIDFTGIDARVLPESTSVRKVDTALQTQFPSNQGRRINVAVEAPGTAARDVQRYATDLRRLPNVASVERPIKPGADLWQVDVVPRHSDLDERTIDVVKRIRDASAPFPVAVTGPTAEFIDQKASLGDHLPFGLALLAVITLIILFALTGSVILPLKSLLMNLLTVSAAFGLLVLIFQDGRLEGLLSYDSQGGIELTQPLLLFALAFGLSTDYAVFLLTRIKEARDAGESEEESVAIGIERTGRIVTSAALLFCIAIGAFATSQIIFIKQIGVGTAFAVIVDATIVRALLVPSLMAMLGRRNWWAPGPLRLLHNRFGISEST